MKPSSEASRAAHSRPTHILIVFAALTICNTLAALYAPIQDCDEVFNYWEPSAYLTHHHGFQTWEYAPQFAIRSWSYAGLHAMVIGTISLIMSKKAAFYGLRIMLGLVCTACETRLFSSISRTLNERVAILFTLIAMLSPGMYHASIAYLPSSFAMYTAMLGAAAFMDWTNGLQTEQGIFWFACGACLGWPFAAALSLPFLAEELLLAFLSDDKGRTEFILRTSRGVGASLLLLGIQVFVDASFYRKLTIVPLNIVLYNVFSSKGPELYGTEPWHFYIRNLALNFHIWFFLALLALPIFLIQLAMHGVSMKRVRGLVCLSPLYLWLVIFTLQPHKEERFMYPAYGFLILNAAFTLHTILSALGHNTPGTFVARVPVLLRLSIILLLLTGTALLSMLRIAGTWTAFSAPLYVYDGLASENPGNVCLGKEWYRFPSHYLLPDQFEAKFIKSEFNGLLPGEFQKGSSLYAGTWMIPEGMNDDNLEDLSKYVDILSCDYLVDSNLPGTSPTTLEPDYIHDNNTWQTIQCLSFLDAAMTPTIPRLLWTPDLPFLPRALKRIWGSYCLLKRVKAD